MLQRPSLRPTEKWCPGCQQWLPHSSFFPSVIIKGSGKPCRSCNNNRRKKWAHKHPPAYLRAVSRQAEKMRADTPFYLWKRAKERAAKESLPFTITVADVVVPEFCPVLGILLVRQRQHARPGSPTLDRFIPARGYVPGNVAVISFRANSLKRDGTFSEFTQLVSWMAGYTIALDDDQRAAVVPKSGSELFANAASKYLVDSAME